MTRTWLVVADDSSVGSLLDLAAGPGAPVAALVVGPRALADELSGSVADVHWLDTAAAPAAGLAGAAAAHVVGLGPVGAVVTGSGAGGRAVAAAIAAAAGADVLADVSAVTADAGELVVTHLLWGGLVERRVATPGPVVLVAHAHGRPTATVVGSVTVVPAVASALAVVDVAPAPAAGDDLQDATRVVGVGRGLRAPDDLALVSDLADALGAQVACSRPLAEGLGWLPADRYLGVSGARIAPRLYVAVGISGQGQHMIGVRDAGTIVAVNSDPDAPIVAQADWTLVGDLYDVLPALTAALREPTR